jgi:ribosome-associated protein
MWELKVGDFAVPEDELQWRFVRASGPGGQNVNKVSTAVQLRFDAAHSRSLPEDIRIRLMRLAGRRMTSEGVLLIDARRFRTQARNREDALERLAALLHKAAAKPALRKPTNPSAAARRRRVTDKIQRGEVKRLRKAPREDT